MDRKNEQMAWKGVSESMLAYLKIRNVLMIILAVLLIKTVPAPLKALDDAGSLRCDQESIMTGDTEFKVKTTCGEPDSIIVRGFAKKVWIYNFGPTKFIYYLTFINGRLERIQVGEYGSYPENRILD